MDLTVNSKIIASTQVQFVQLVPLLGAFELVFLFNGTIHGKSDDMYRWINLAGARVALKAIDGRAIDLGLAKSDKPATIRQMDNSTPLGFELRLVLMPHQIELLEAARDGGDLNFVLKFHARSNSSKSAGPEQDEYFEMAVPVAESAWIAQLNSSKASRVLLFEVRLPLADGGIRHPADRHLLRAQELFTAGNWRECVSECRQFAEELGGDRLGPALVRLREDRIALTKREREDVVIAALKYYCHLAAHSESQHGDLSHDREDAKLALSLAASLAGHYFNKG